MSEWVLGYALAYEVFDEVGISAPAIEDAVAGTPALLTFLDFHTALASTAALAAARVDGPRRFGEGAEIVCVDGGRPASCASPARSRLVIEVVPQRRRGATARDYRTRSAR